METRATRSAVSLGAGTSLGEAARLMTALDLSSVPVLENEAVAGTLFYHDVLRGLRRARHDHDISALITRDDPIDPGADPKPPESALAAPTPGAVDERVPLLEPDVLLPSQYFDRVRRSAEYEPERRLLVAVLQQGVHDYVRHAGARDRRELELWRDVEQWVEDRDASWLFSFESICNVLGLEPDYLRRGLHAHKERARRPAGEEAPREGTPDTAPAIMPERGRATSG